jgi:hypothetical protein
MGLFVVSRLAARHGIRVRLRHTQTHGVSALVWLPETLAEVDMSPPPAVPRGRRTIDPVGVQSSPARVPSGQPGWFRRTDKSNGTVKDLSPAWTSPADDGFRAARAVASPAVGEASSAGLPRRVPNANLLPGSVGQPAGQQADAPAATATAYQAEAFQQPVSAHRRSPEERRSRLAEFQRGAQQGRSDAPWNFGAEE